MLPSYVNRLQLLTPQSVVSTIELIVLQVNQIIAQFEHVALNVGVSVMNTSPEELVYVAVQRGVISLMKPAAVTSFHEEVL